jgi:hypothetical protein
VRLVRDAIDDGWLDDVPPNLDAHTVGELLAVAVRMEGLVITAVADVFRWDWGTKGTYSAKSCYLGSLVPLPNVGSSSGWRCVIDAGQQIGSSGGVCRGPELAPFVTRSKIPSHTCCLAACWRGQCGPPVCVGGTKRTVFRRSWPRLQIGCNPGVEGKMTRETSRGA